jgi:hypothetical protein
MSHFIDMSDHFAHFDAGINIYNFLQFTPRQWQLIDNSIQPQNRLRVDDFRQMFRDAGIDITEEIARLGHLDQLKEIKLDKAFSTKKPEDVAVSHVQMITQMSG